MNSDYDYELLVANQRQHELRSEMATFRLANSIARTGSAGPGLGIRGRFDEALVRMAEGAAHRQRSRQRSIDHEAR